MKASRMKTALLGSGAAIALMAAAVPASADEISDLRNQIEQMQDRVAQIEADRAQQRRVSSAAAVEAGDRPRTWQLPGTNTSMMVGGYAKLDIIHDFGGQGGDAFAGGGVPLEGSLAHGRQNATRFHARQSRLFVRTWTPTDWGELATHIEGDFFGLANTGVTNANGFHLRHAYGSLGPVLAGQTWTNWMPLYSLPETIDFGGPTGLIFVRQAQLRYTHNFGNGWLMAFSLEDPLSGSIAGPVPGKGRFPDIVLTIRKSHTWWGRGVIGAGVVLQDLNYDGGGNLHDSELGWGVYVAFGQVFNDRFRMGGAFHVGEGIGKYMVASSGTFDVIQTFTPGGTSSGTFDVDPVFHISFNVWGRWNWTDNIRSTVAFGMAHNEREGVYGANAGLTGDTMSIHANLIWSPVPQVNIGAEFIYGNRRAFGVPGVGDLYRLQIGFQYSF